MSSWDNPILMDRSSRKEKSEHFFLMPNFGFNPFVPRVNVYTTGVDTGDSRRYYSRDVIRMGHERVEIDATLTPGEPGRRHQTQFERDISEMARREREFPFAKDKKLQFIEGETIQRSASRFAGLKTHEEYVSLLWEEKRRAELSRYHLSKVEFIVVNHM